MPVHGQKNTMRKGDFIGIFTDLTGMRFGSLTAIKRCGVGSNGCVLWLCKCDCGNISKVRSDGLKNGHTKTCGRCPINKFIVNDEITVGITAKGESFIFDTELLDIVNKYTWYMDERKCLKTNLTSKKILRLHSLILGENKGLQIDHINHNPSDNRKANLRVVTQQQNIFNNPLRADNTTGFKGVSFNKCVSKYQANIVLNGKSHYLGVYKHPEEAAKAYNQKAIELFGEYAFLNPV